MAKETAPLSATRREAEVRRPEFVGLYNYCKSIVSSLVIARKKQPLHSADPVIEEPDKGVRVMSDGRLHTYNDKTNSGFIMSVMHSSGCNIHKLYTVPDLRSAAQSKGDTLTLTSYLGSVSQQTKEPLPIIIQWQGDDLRKIPPAMPGVAIEYIQKDLERINSCCRNGNA